MVSWLMAGNEFEVEPVAQRYVLFRKMIVLVLTALFIGGICPAFAAPVYAATDPAATRKAITDADFLHVDAMGGIVTKAGAKVVLRGVNLGGWLIQEHWMDPVLSDWDLARAKELTDKALYDKRDRSTTDPSVGADKTRLWSNLDTLDTLTAKFSQTDVLNLYKTFEDNWITTDDLDRIADAGCNVVRVPFWYRNFVWSDSKVNGDWQWIGGSFEASPGVQKLNWLMEEAGKRGIYVILDMHGVPGGQSLNHSSGTWGVNNIFSGLDDPDQNDLQLMEELWKKIAGLYKNNPVVAAYDIMNEPNNNDDFNKSVENYYESNSSSANDRTNAIYERMINVIRNDVGDAKHIITIEGIWKASNLPDPKLMGWTNMMYQVHLYNDTASFAANAKETALLCKEYGVAAYVGEFNNPDGIAICENMAKDPDIGQAINWTTWTYKIGNIDSAKWVDNDNYCWVNMALPLADVQNDSLDAIAANWGTVMNTPKADDTQDNRMLKAVKAATQNAKLDQTIRDVVLVIDTSGSMGFANNKPLATLKQAAIKFCEETFSRTSATRIGIVRYSDSVSTPIEFTDDLQKITDVINRLSASGGTDIGLALNRADNLLATKARTTATKAIVLMTDGRPENGATYTSNDAKYSYTEYGPYASFASAVYRTALPLKSKYDIYTLGFFHSFAEGSTDMKLGQQLLKDIQNNGYYNVVNPGDLDFIFGNISNAIATNDYPIIVIPGIMGSELKDQLGLTAWPFTLGNTIQMPTFPVDFCFLLDMSTAYKPVMGGYGSYDDYKTLITQLQQRFPNRQVIFFGYDWRFSAYDAAQKLKDYVDNVLKADKIDIVAHSMGGLVAAQYAADASNAAKINTVVTLGTPYEGAPMLLGVVELYTPLVGQDGFQGYLAQLLKMIKESPGIDQVANRRLFAKLPGVMDLTPTKNYVDAGYFSVMKRSNNTDQVTMMSYPQYQDYCNILFGNIPYKLAVDRQASIKDKNGASVLASLPRSFFIVGDEQRTVSRFIFAQDLKGLADLGFDSGDGTVPYASASMLGALSTVGGDRLIVRHGISHGGLTEDPATLNRVMDLLDSKNLPSVGEAEGQGKPYIVVRIACPVDVTVSKGGENLSSVSGSENNETGFGELYRIGENEDIKILAMDSDQYTINMNGTGKGTMDYEARYFNETNTLVKKDTFTGVPITETTKITSVTDQNTVNRLDVDSNGDGSVDRVIYPDGNGSNTPPPATPAPTQPPKPGTNVPTGSNGVSSGNSNTENIGAVAEDDVPVVLAPPIDDATAEGTDIQAAEDLSAGNQATTIVIIVCVIAALAATVIVFALRRSDANGPSSTRSSSGVGPGRKYKGDSTDIGPGRKYR